VRKKLVKCYIWSIDMCGADIRALGRMDQK